jgi:hypothetical protein
MTEITLRPAAMDDIPRIAQVNVACWRSAYRDIVDAVFLASLSTQDFARRFRERAGDKTAITRVAASPQGVAGFCTGGPNRGNPSEIDAEVYSIYVHDSCQGRGIGKKLIHSVVSELIEQGYAAVIIWTFRDNPYRRFYDSLGGRVVRESSFELGGTDYVIVGYAWPDMQELLRTAWSADEE